MATPRGIHTSQLVSAAGNAAQIQTDASRFSAAMIANIGRSLGDALVAARNRKDQAAERNRLLGAREDETARVQGNIDRDFSLRAADTAMAHRSRAGELRSALPMLTDPGERDRTVAEADAYDRRALGIEQMAAANVAKQVGRPAAGKT